MSKPGLRANLGLTWRKTFAIINKLVWVWVFPLIWVSPFFSVNALAAEAEFVLAGPLRRDLIALAKEPLLAVVEGRAPRTPTPIKDLSPPLPMVVSLYLNGQLAARTWRLEGLGQLRPMASELGAEILVDPKIGRLLTEAERPQATISVAILRNLQPAKDDRDIGPHQAAIVFYGMRQSVGLPSDAPPPLKAKDLLGLTCQLVGLRPGAWMTGQGTILTAQAAEAFEK